MKKKLSKIKRLISWQKITNALTISRILIGLPVVFAITNDSNDIFFFLILLGGLTDFLDGYFARKYKCKSVIGAKLDPLADKILLLGPMIWLVHEDIIPLWAIWLILSRELLITSWRSNKSTGAPASIHGKYKTVFQFTSIILLLWPDSWGEEHFINLLNNFGYFLFWVSLILTLFSAKKYIFNQKEPYQN